jgi:hypothetical protein
MRWACLNLKYYDLKEEVMKAEQQLLRIMSYCFSSDSQYYYLLMLNHCNILKLPKEAMQIAWNILNDR